MREAVAFTPAHKRIKQRRRSGHRHHRVGEAFVQPPGYLVDKRIGFNGHERPQGAAHHPASDQIDEDQRNCQQAIAQDLKDKGGWPKNLGKRQCQPFKQRRLADPVGPLEALLDGQGNLRIVLTKVRGCGKSQHCMSKAIKADQQCRAGKAGYPALAFICTALGDTHDRLPAACHKPSFSRTNCCTACGLALPPVAFIT